MPKHPSHVLELARRGAEVRLRELVNEAKNLIGLFPDLRDSFDKDELPLKFIMAEGSGATTKTSGRRTRHLSPAARKAASLRMKKMWAARRKAKKA